MLPYYPLATFFVVNSNIFSPFFCPNKKETKERMRAKCYITINIYIFSFE
ncbi:unnamed protein product [Meloidogyne enterolobii]|uniref:Uncharacterized protein n=1 Tax=Meloidogyne enterolobii TaxID=390850 RepID=A0ACB0YJP8_MELEN